MPYESRHVWLTFQYSFFYNAVCSWILYDSKNLFLHFFYITDQYKIQEICNGITYDDPFPIKYVPDQWMTQNICDKAHDDCLAPLKYAPDWFVTSTMIKIHFTALYADKNILCFNEDSSNVVFIPNNISNDVWYS